MRILLIIIQYPPDVNSTGLLMHQIFSELAGSGVARVHGEGDYQVDVITSFPHYEHFAIWEEYRGKLYQQGEWEGLEVLRTWVYASGSKQNMMRRLVSYLSFNLLAAVAGLVRRRRYDVIFCTNGGFFSGLTGAVIGRLKGIPIVYNVQDLYPEVPVRAGQLSNKWAIRGLEQIERLMYRVADQISVITPSFRDNMVGKGVDPAKITVVPNFVDSSFIRPLPKDNAFSRQHGLVDRFVVSHAGNIGYAYDLGTLLEAAALLRGEREILFLIVGDGVAKAGLEARAAELGLENVRFLPFQPLEDLPWLRAASDVQVSLYAPGSASYSMPSKVYEIMASGRPLLASADPGSDIWNLITAAGAGICVEPEDAGRLAEAILRLYGRRDLGEEMGRCGREYAVSHYTKGSVVEQYRCLLDGLCQ
jgi:colanic acid biosynthesis glycosyl transferase WcaI